MLQPWSLSADEEQWLTAIRQRAGARIAENEASSMYCANPFNLLRWSYAYEHDLDQAAKKLERHLRIRDILDLDNIETLEDGIDEAADEYAPMHLLGRVSETDNRVLLLEQSGRYDLQTIMTSIRTSSFMMNRFRLVERIMEGVRAEERRDGKMSSAVMIVDLEGLQFQSNLIKFISGPYRILWGTLIEQYPYFISEIFVINPPAFMSVLWNACSSFIPAEYRKKIKMYSGDDFRVKLASFVSPEILPVEYGGTRATPIPHPIPCVVPVPKAQLAFDEIMLDTLVIPAGGSIVHVYRFDAGDCVEFFMKHDQELTMNIFFHEQRRKITKPDADVAEMEEAYAGCERPGIPTLDNWRWTVPRTGYYHAIYGNEKAWIMSVVLQYQVFRTNARGLKIKVNPLE